jgi:hypothetical protein
MSELFPSIDYFLLFLPHYFSTLYIIISCFPYVKCLLPFTCTINNFREAHTEKKLTSYLCQEIQRDWVLSHIWLTAPSYMVKNLRIYSYTVLGSPSSYITFHPIPPEFPHIWGNFCFLLYQCTSRLFWSGSVRRQTHAGCYLPSPPLSLSSF